MTEPYIGQISLVPYNFAPRGWADCNGQLLPIAEYSALFSLLGTTYGGDGRTTFGLPDLRNRSAVHEGAGPGLDNFRLGQRGGVRQIRLGQEQLPSHSHGLSRAKVVVPISSGTADQDEGEGNYLANGTFYHNEPDAAYGDNNVNINGTTDDTGASQGIPISPPYLTLRYVIALVGQYPSRN